MITPDVLRRAGVRSPDAWAAPLQQAANMFRINTAQRVAGFLANVLHESGNLTRLVESLDYSPAGLRATWPARYNAADANRMGRTTAHKADQFAIAERSYGGRMGNRTEGAGDGFAYRGRGLIQITGRDGYGQEGQATGLPINAVGAWLETIPGACQSAARWWARVGCNELMDRGGIREARVRLNGGTIGLDDVLARYAAILPMLGGGAAQPAASAVSDTDRLNDASLTRARSSV